MRKSFLIASLLAAVLAGRTLQAQPPAPPQQAKPPAPPQQAPPPAAPQQAQPPATPQSGAASPFQEQRPVQSGPGGPFWFCGAERPAPAKQPPAGSAPIVLAFGPCFPTQGGVSVIEPETYLYYIQLKPSRPSQDSWVPWNDDTEKTVVDDFKRLWGTNFLDNLSIDVTDYVFPNGAIGKLVSYDMEERQRVKIVDYEGGRALEQTKIDEKLKEESAQIRLDSFIDPGIIKKVKGVVQSMLAEKGFQYATVTPEIKPLPGGPKLVNLTFHIKEGPQVKIESVEFAGNKQVSAWALKRQMKNNKTPWWPLSWFTWLIGHSTYQEAKYEEDADKVMGYYRDHGYIAARVGDAELKVLEDSKDRRTRWVQVRIPIAEGDRFRIGKLEFADNKVVKTEGLKQLFKMRPGDWYSDKAVRKGLEKAREVYGGIGYFEFTGYPDLTPHTPAGGPAAPEGQVTAQTGGEPSPGAAPPAAAAAAEPAAAGAAAPAKAADGKAAVVKAGQPVVASASTAPLVDVTLRMQEGKQYFVNRITFVGNTTTRDTVVRREMRLVENGVFNTEALKYSIKRINQLSYFKALEGGKDVDVQKTPNADNKVDVTLKFEEQNRNQLTFGAGVSQYEGYFGQLGFQTANFMGRGETFSVNLQAGSRAQNYQVGFTEPYLWDRNITGGVDVFHRTLRYISQFTQKSTGGNVVFGFPLADFTRMFINYSLEHTQVSDVNPIFTENPAYLQSNPYLAETLLTGAGGARTISKIVPSIALNTIDNPIFPTSGRRYTVSVDLAGIGGDTNFYKPMVEGVWYIQQSKRTSIGLRGQLEYIAPFTGSGKALPIWEKLYLGGEYSIRGFDIRTIGPKVVTPATETNGQPFVAGVANLQPFTSGLVIGGNKSMLFNAEYLISIAGPVRLVLFYDAGQALDTGQKFAMNQFRTSTGAEIRFFMPVLNVPFRLIMAYDPQRAGILDNNLNPQKKFSFRFAVGSTF
jgi:outer membrane protein assembly factor BamA